MLTITVEGGEWFDNEKEEFSKSESFVLELEHSLVSLSKWESIYKRPFLAKDDKTQEEILTYVKCMTLNSGVPDDVYRALSAENVEAIGNYIESPESATWFNEPKRPSRPASEQITAELIYYWMVVHQIPFTCETWHLNRLFNLIKICNIKSEKPKKKSPGQAAQEQRDLNAQRRAQLNSKG